MKHRYTYLKFNRYTISSLGLLIVVIAAGSIIITRHNHTDAATLAKPAASQPVGAAVPSEFKFTGTTNWWQGATNKTSMALFHSIHDSCFVSVQHKSDTISADQANRQKDQASLESNGYVVKPIAAQTLTLQTKAGPQQYQLQQSAVTTPTDASKLDGGQEFGYLQLKSGYIFIEGHCETSDELAATIPALQAINFDN